MKILYKSIVFLFFAFFTANAALNPFDIGSIGREKGKVANPSALNNKRTSVYMHPIILLFGANAKTVFLYSTIESPMSLYNALIIKPSVWNDGENLLRIGSDLGLRHYLAGRGEGLYLQPQVGVFHFSAKGKWLSDLGLEDNGKRTWSDGMLYLGQAYKFAYVSIYSDVGIGYRYALGFGSLLYDANVGLGFSF